MYTHILVAGWGWSLRALRGTVGGLERATGFHVGQSRPAKGSACDCPCVDTGLVYAYIW